MRRREQQELVETGGILQELATSLPEHALEAGEKSEPLRRRGRLVRRAHMAADVIALSLAFVVAEAVFGNGDGSGLALFEEIALFVPLLAVWVLVAKLYGLYEREERRGDRSTVDELVAVFHLVTVAVWLLFGAASLTNVADPDLRKLASFWLLAIALVPIARMTARTAVRRRLSYVQNAVVVGAGDVGQLIARKFVLNPEYGINVLGFVDSVAKEMRPELQHLSLLGPPQRLPTIVRVFGVERVVIAFPNYSYTETLDLVRSLKDLDVQIDIAPQLFEVIGPTVGIHTVEGFPLIALPRLRLSRSSQLTKRAMDVALSSAALVLLAPVFLLIALLIKLDTPGPVFYRQIRMGAADQTFTLLKFRTMVVGADEQKDELAHLNIHRGEGPALFKIENDPRVTRVGRFLRRYFLDELAQLVNVLRGEMSLVGPRPLILEEDRHVSEWARRRLDLKPGMTGLWQVLGRRSIPFDEMVKLDYLYVTTWSLTNDIRLLLRTIPLVLRGEAGGY